MAKGEQTISKAKYTDGTCSNGSQYSYSAAFSSVLATRQLFHQHVGDLDRDGEERGRSMSS